MTILQRDNSYMGISVGFVKYIIAKLDPKAAKTLGPALATLEKHGAIHGSLKKGFAGIYGYTSDQEGIRHALIENSTSEVDEHDAIFMIGACASFVSYLIGKARKANIDLS